MMWRRLSGRRSLLPCETHELAAKKPAMWHEGRRSGGVSKLIRDPQLDDLVRSLNQGKPEVERQGETGEELERLLIEMAQRGASDLLLVAGSPPVFRVGGLLTPSTAGPLSGDELSELFAGVLG